MFDITVQNNSEIYLFGSFNAASIQKADQVLSTIDTDCIIDFQGLEYISSAGLGSLIKTHVRLKNQGHTFKLKNMNDHIREVFRYSGLDKVMLIE